jgi:WD40 repeat protein
MRYLALSLMVIFLSLSPVYAQDGYALPDDLQPITPENATQLTILSQLGSATSHSVAWSDDGQTLIAGTSDGDYLFHYPDLTNPELVEHQFPTELQYFTADGSVLITYEGDGIRLADAETLEEFSFLPTRGGIQLTSDRRIAVVSYGGYTDETGEYHPYNMELWNVETQTLITTVVQDLANPVGPFITARGVLVGSVDLEQSVAGTVQLLDLETGEPIRTWNTFYRPAVSPDGRWMLIVSHSYAELVSLDDFSTVRLFEMEEESGAIFRGLFSPDSALVVTETWENVSLWDIAAVVEGDIEPFAVLPDEWRPTFSHDGHLLITSDKVWRVENHTVELQYTLSAETMEYFSAFPYFSPDDRLIRLHNLIIDSETGELVYEFPAIADLDLNLNEDWSQAAYWDKAALVLVNLTERTAHTLMTLEGYLGDLIAINAISEIALFYDDETLRVYDMRTGEQRLAVNEVRLYADGGSYAAFNENGTRLVVGLASDYQIWDTVTGTLLLPPDFMAFDPALSADGHLLAFVSIPPTRTDLGLFRHSIEIWDMDAGERIDTLTVESQRMPVLTFSPDRSMLAVIIDEAVQFYELASLEDEPSAVLQFQPNNGFYLQPHRVQFSHDGRYIAVGTFFAGVDGAYDNYVFLLPLEQVLTENVVINHYRNALVSADLLSFSPDDSLLLVRDPQFGGAFEPAPQMRLLDITGQEIMTFGAALATFSPNNDLIASWGNVQLWDVAALRAGSTEPLITLDSDTAYGAAFNADGTLLFVHDQWRVNVWGIGD